MSSGLVLVIVSALAKRFTGGSKSRRSGSAPIDLSKVSGNIEDITRSRQKMIEPTIGKEFDGRVPGAAPVVVSPGGPRVTLPILK